MNRKELVEKMLSAYSRVHYGHNRPTDGYNDQAMGAALSVATDELLGEPSAKEWGDTAYRGGGDRYRERDGKCFLDCAGVGVLLSNRRAKLERVKTPEERVTVAHNDHDPGGWLVLLDNEYKFGCDGIARCDAEIYRLGLIQQLKDSAQ